MWSNEQLEVRDDAPSQKPHTLTDNPLSLHVAADRIPRQHQNEPSLRSLYPARLPQALSQLLHCVSDPSPIPLPPFPVWLLPWWLASALDAWIRAKYCERKFVDPLMSPKDMETLTCGSEHREDAVGNSENEKKPDHTAYPVKPSAITDEEGEEKGEKVSLNVEPLHRGKIDQPRQQQTSPCSLLLGSR